MKIYNRGIILLFFLIAASNSDVKLYYWFFLEGRGTANFSYNSFFAVGFVAAGLLIIKYIRRSEHTVLKPESPGIVIALTLWLAGGTLSLVWNAAITGVIKNYIGGFFVPMIIFLALRGSFLDENRINRIFFTISLGLLIPLILGIMAYYREWGIPNLNTLVFSRYNLIRMESYMQVTYGNTGQIAQLILLTGPPLLVLALDKNRPLFFRIYFGFCLLLMALNLLIVQSMTSFLVGIVVFLLLIIFRRYYKFLLFTLMVFLVGAFTYNQFFMNISRLFMTRQNSLLERIDAIQDSLAVFMNNWLFGVGQGLSHLYIPATSAHQFFLQQGVELGILGFLASIVIVVIVFSRMARLIISGPGNQDNVSKFILLIGPFAYLLYGVITNVIINSGSNNIWICLLIGFLALADFKPAADKDLTGLDDFQKNFLLQFGSKLDQTIKIPSKKG